MSNHGTKIALQDASSTKSMHIKCYQSMKKHTQNLPIQHDIEAQASLILFFHSMHSSSTQDLRGHNWVHFAHRL